MLTKPTDPYDPVWPAYWAANPQQFRSVGSQAAEADDGAAEAEAAAAAEAKVAADAEAAEKVKADADAKTAADAKAAAAKAKKAGEADWRTAIEDEDHRKFAERFTGPGDAVKAAFDLRKQASERFEAPGKDATDEQRAEWRTRIGVPEAPGGYEVDVPEDTPEDVVPTAEDLTPFLAAMHEADAPPAAVQAAVDYFYGDYLKAGQESLEERQVEAEKANTKAIETEWPDEADRATNSQFALRASVHFGGPSFKKFVTETRVGGVLLADHLEFVRPFAKIGRRITEKGVQIGMSEEETKDQESKLDELTAEAHAADQAGDIKKRDRLFAERDKLSKETYGTEAVVGEESRVL